MNIITLIQDRFYFWLEVELLNTDIKVKIMILHFLTLTQEKNIFHECSINF